MANKTIDYIVVGHVARDLIGDGFTLGGTVAYSGLTAKALGREVGIVTSFEETLDTSFLDSIQIYNLPSEVSTTFENISEGGSRRQILHARSVDLGPESIPLEWQSADLVHLGPIANEVNPQLVNHFDASFIGITPQGWMRRWDNSGQVYYAGWVQIADLLPVVDAVVISIEDVGGDERIVSELAQSCRILAVTQGAEGVAIYQNGKPSSLPAPEIKEVDPTGSGDIFAAAFFVHLQEVGDPVEAGRFATEIASTSISESGLQSVPSPSDVAVVRNRFYP